ARTNRKAERHGLQRTRLVAGNLEAFHLRRKGEAAVADRHGGPAAAFAEQSADAGALADEIDGVQDGARAAEGEPRFVEEPALDTLHRKGDGAAGADGVEAELVALLRSAQHGVAFAHAAQRAEREEALVFDAHAFAAERVDVLAADRAGD